MKEVVKYNDITSVFTIQDDGSVFGFAGVRTLLLRIRLASAKFRRRWTSASVTFWRICAVLEYLNLICGLLPGECSVFLGHK
jgi:hypothetical protein